MPLTKRLILPALLLLAAPAVAEGPQIAAVGGATDALLHAVLREAPDTPGRRSYVDLADAEGRAALAALARVETAETPVAAHRLVWVALNAIDPAAHPSKEGLGYGMLKAVESAADRIARAARAAAVQPTAATSVPALAAAHNTIGHLRAAQMLGEQALSARDLAEVKRSAAAMREQLDYALSGEDRDGDGTLVWYQGETGLAQMAAESTRMALGTLKGE